MQSITKNRIYWINLIAIILISLNLRAPISSIGPILEMIKDHYHLNAMQAGMLTFLPLLAFGIISFIVAFFQPLQAMLFGIVALFIGEALRGFGNSTQLFIGTAMMGSGIAIANVLLPSMIKAKFPREIPKIMGIYSLTLNISTTLGFAMILPLTHLLSLPMAIFSWSILALFAITSFFPLIKNSRISRFKSKKIDIFSTFKQLNAWKISLFMGFTSMLAYSFMAWYPSMIYSFGYDYNFTSGIMIYTQCIVMPVSLLAPLILNRTPSAFRTYFMILLCGCYTLGFSLLLISHNVIITILASTLISIPVGGSFSIALLFISSKSSSIQVAAKLSAMAQGIGYLIASLGPLIIGSLYDHFSSFTPALFLLAFLGFILSILGLLANRVTIIK